MSRLATVLPGTMDAEQLDLYQALVDGRRAGATGDKLFSEAGALRGPFNPWLYAPCIGMLAQRLGERLRFDGVLAPGQREIAILCVAVRWEAHYEWWAHARIAAECGVPAGVIEAIFERRDPVLSDPGERAVHRFACALLDTRAVSAPVYREAIEALGEAAVVELVTLLGYYTMISMTLNAFEVDLPPGAEPPFAARAPV